MIRDLRTILEDWDFEPGKISVRKIIGRDGREKIQTRIDLGLLQLECTGRPDGRRPFACESLFAYQEQRLQEHLELYGDDEGFVLDPEDCRELRHEAYLYYQRYLSSFVLEEYDAVEQDTARNLRLIDFCERYAAREADRVALSNQRAYVVMMHARARAYSALHGQSEEVALGIVDAAIAQIEQLCDTVEDGEQDSARELVTLRELRTEILQKLPDDAPPRLQAALDRALLCEDYEEAAMLRDRLAGAARPVRH